LIFFCSKYCILQAFYKGRYPLCPRRIFSFKYVIQVAALEKTQLVTIEPFKPSLMFASEAKKLLQHPV
jgi:hypothetical protein